MLWMSTGTKDEEHIPIYAYSAPDGVPGGLVGGPRAYQDQFRGFKSHRVHARRDFFLHRN